MADDLETKIRDGKAADAILKDPGVASIIDKLAAEWLMQSCKLDTLEEREEARRKFRTLDAIQNRLKTYVANGRQAERDLAQK